MYTATERNILSARQSLATFSRANSLIGSLNQLQRCKSQPLFELSHSVRMVAKKKKRKVKNTPKETISDYDTDYDDPKTPLLKATC